jgi:hypothetical protein
LRKKKKERQEEMKKTGSSFVFLILSFILLVSGRTAFAETSVRAALDRDQMGIGDAVTLTVEVDSDQDFEDALPKLPKIPGIEEINSSVGARQSSSSMMIQNGTPSYSTRISQTYQYLLSPQKEGKFIIPVIDVVVNGKTYKTQPLTLEVKEEFRNAKKKNTANPKRRFPPGFGDDDDDENDPFGGAQSPEDLFEQMLQQQQRMFRQGLPGTPGIPQQNEIQSKKLDVNTNDPFFIYLDVDKHEAYEGEQVTANWYIYTKGNVESLDRVKFPDLKGFWKEIIEEVPSLQFTEEIVNGVRYRKALLASHALFPIKAGSAIIDEFRIKAKIRNLTQFGWGKSFDVTKASKRTEIKVLPLPQEGRTTSFSGAVGSYRVTLKTDGTTFPANQPFSIHIRYEGIGNAKLIDLPAIQWPEGLEVYDTKSEAKFFKEGNSYKEFEVLVIPRKTGEMRIPPLALTYFDPAQKKYVSASTDEIVLQITEGTAAVPQVSSGTTTNAKNAEAAFAPQPILQLPANSFFSWTQYRVAVYSGVAVLALILMLFFTFREMRGLSSESEIFALANTKLEKIEQSQSQNDFRKVGSEATNLLYLLVANLAGKKKADQELHILVKEMSSKDQQKYLERINGLFDYFQLLGFSPEEIMKNTLNRRPIDEQIKQLKNLTKEVVDNLRKEDKNNS